MIRYTDGQEIKDKDICIPSAGLTTSSLYYVKAVENSMILINDLVTVEPTKVDEYYLQELKNGELKHYNLVLLYRKKDWKKIINKLSSKSEEIDIEPPKDKEIPSNLINDWVNLTCDIQ